MTMSNLSVMLKWALLWRKEFHFYKYTGFSIALSHREVSWKPLIANRFYEHNWVPALLRVQTHLEALIQNLCQVHLEEENSIIRNLRKINASLLINNMLCRKCEYSQRIGFVFSVLLFQSQILYSYLQK